MPRATANGIEIEYESFGSQDDETILLIMGLGAQLTRWPVELCNDLAARGYRVIRFDNRDSGLSTRMERDHALAWSEAAFSMMQGKPAFVAYTLKDMAADAVGLLDALGIEKAHIVGASMGGMIAQHVAFDFPEHTLSLTCIMSSSGNPMLPPAKSRAYSLFLSPAPSPKDTHAIVARGIKTYETLGSPGFPTDVETLREWAERDATRAYYPAGVLRQMAAVMVDGDRRAKLGTITVPAVVLHGEDDPLVPVAAGLDTASNIPGAEMRVVPGMGHDMPIALVPVIADAITSAAVRATGVPPVRDALPEMVARDSKAPRFDAVARGGFLTRLRLRVLPLILRAQAWVGRLRAKIKL